MVAPVIHIGDATIQTTVEQKTYPSLHIMDHTGAVYHVAVRAQDEQLRPEQKRWSMNRVR